MRDIEELSDMPARSAQRKLIEQHDAIIQKDARIAELEAALDHMHKGHDALVAYIAELDAEVRFAYLECEDAVRYYDYEADLLETDVGGLLENMRHMIKGIRDTAIPKNRYQNITDNKAAWQRMLAARNALKRKKVKAKGDP